MLFHILNATRLLNIHCTYCRLSHLNLGNRHLDQNELGLPKFGSVQFFDHFPRTVNLDLKNRFYGFKNRFKPPNLEMTEGRSKRALYAPPAFLVCHICVDQ